MRSPARPALLLVVLVAVVAAGQTPPRDAPAGAGTAAVSGRVVAADTGAPQPGATVWLSGARAGESPRATTDAQGRFRITALEAGRYIVNVMPARDRAGYLGTSRRLGGPKSTVVEIRDGQVLDGVTVTLEPGARLTGRVVDDRGDPMARMLVNAISARGVGAARFAPAALAETDDRGDFRMPDIEPGDYVVRAMGLRGGSDRNAGTTYLPTFHPGTTRRADAAVVTVAGGEQRAGIDIRLVPGHYASISGDLIGLDAQAVARARVVATAIDAGYSVMSAPRPPQPDGTFRITGLAPGEYVVIGWIAASRPGEIDAVSDAIRIANLDADVDNVRLTASPGVRVAGRIVTASGDAPPFGPDRVEVAALPVGAGLGQFVLRRDATVGKDWTFDLAGVHGPFVVRLASLPDPDWALTSVRLDGRDVSDWPLDRATSARELELVIGNRGSKLGGHVIGPDGRPAIHRPVLVFPAEPGRLDVTSLRFRHGTSDETGVYGFGVLAPGDYFVVALDEDFRIESIADRRALEPLVALAQRVSLEAEQVRTIDLRLGGERRRE